MLVIFFQTLTLYCDSLSTNDCSLKRLNILKVKTLNFGAENLFNTICRDTNCIVCYHGTYRLFVWYNKFSHGDLISKCFLPGSLKHISTHVIWGPKVSKCILLPWEAGSSQHTSTPVMWEPKMSAYILSRRDQGSLKHISTSAMWE